MCGGGSENTTTTTQTQSLPPWLQQNYQNLQSQAQGIAATPYEPYSGQRVAQLSDAQQKAINTADAMQGNYEGDLNTARTYGNMAAQNVAGNYYNPTNFTTQAINVPTITPQQAQAQYAQAQYAPAAAQAQTQYAQAQQAQAQYAQAQYARAQQAGYAQAQAPAAVQAQGIGAMQIGSGHVGTGQFDQNAFKQYGSPYQQDVIDATMAELNRQKTLDQNNATSQATLGGAFGGDRAAVQQAEIGRNYGQIQAQALAGLNNQNWAQAQNMFTNDQARSLQAQGMNQSAGLQAALANQGTNLQAQQANQSAALQAALANQGWQGNVGLANMGAINTAQLTNAQLGTQANLQNANLGTNTSQFNAGLGTQNSQFNAGLGTQTSQFNAGQGNQVGMYNAGLTTQNNQFNAAQGNQVGMYNAGLGTQNSQFNAGLNYTGQAQNAANSLQAQQFMAGQNLQAQQLADQSRQYYGSLAAADRNRQLAASQQFSNITGQEQQAKLNDIGALMQTGGMQQAQAQQNLDTAYNDFLAQRQYPFQTTSWLSGIYNGTPAPVSSVGTTVTPGPSPISQIAGAGLSAAALYGMYGGFKDGGMARRGLGAVDTKGHRHWTGQPTGYADGGPTQPLSFWGAGPNGISPALQIGLAIMGGQSPHALTNIGQGAAQGLQAQQEGAMNAAKMKLWGAEGRKTSAEADVMEAQQKGLKAFQDAMGGEGGGAVTSGKKGMAATPEMAGLPGGPGTNAALPAPGAAPASPAPSATPAPTPATDIPAPAAPAPNAPAGGGAALPVPAPAPAGGGTVPAAMPAPAAEVPQVGSPATAPALSAPSPVSAVETPHPAAVADALSDFPQLAQALKVTRAGIVSGMGGGHPAVMQMMNQAREALTQAAKDGVAMNSRGEIAPLPGFLATAAQKAATESAAKAAGEQPYKMQYLGAEKNLDLRNQMAVQGAITKREFGLVPLRGAEERKTQAFKIPLEAQYSGPQTFQMRDPNNPNNVYDVTGSKFDFANMGSGGGGMAGFGAGAGGGAPSAAPRQQVSSSPLSNGLDFNAPPSNAVPTGGGAPQPAPTTDAAPEGMPVVPGGGKPAAMPAGSSPPVTVGGLLVGKQSLNPEQTKESTDLGEMRKQVTEEAKAGNMMRARTKELLDVMPTVEMGAGADAKTQWGRWALAFGASPEWVKNNIQNVPGAEIMAKGLNDLVSKQIKEVGREPGMVWQMFKSANPQLETQPESTKLLLNVLDADSQRLEDRSTAFEQWTGAGRSAKGFEHWFNQNYDARHYMDLAYQRTYGLPEGSTFAGNSKADGSMMFKTQQGIVKVSPMKTSKPAAVESLMPGLGGGP